MIFSVLLADEFVFVIIFVVRARGAVAFHKADKLVLVQLVHALVRIAFVVVIEVSAVLAV